MTLRPEQLLINIINTDPKRKNSFPMPSHSVRMKCPHKFFIILTKQSAKGSCWNCLRSQKEFLFVEELAYFKQRCSIVKDKERICKWKLKTNQKKHHSYIDTHEVFHHPFTGRILSGDEQASIIKRIIVIFEHVPREMKAHRNTEQRMCTTVQVREAHILLPSIFL